MLLLGLRLVGMRKTWRRTNVRGGYLVILYLQRSRPLGALDALLGHFLVYHFLLDGSVLRVSIGRVVVHSLSQQRLCIVIVFLLNNDWLR
jgi:hypothetical protein